MLENFHTIVVGSGISGMAAASQLAKSGHSVLVLESNDYIGGRTKSIDVELANETIFKFDEGASWIHGSCQENPITQLSKKIGEVALILTDDDLIVNYDKSGQKVTQQFEVESQQCEKLLEKVGEFEDGSIYEALNKLSSNQLNNKYFMYTISNGVEFQTSGSIYDLSAKYGQQDEQFEGQQMLVTIRTPKLNNCQAIGPLSVKKRQLQVESGYEAFPEYLSGNENIKVLTNHQVIEITFNGEANIVKCFNGQTFQAKNLIISVPIGVLKSNSIRFNPELPDWKQEAIQKIHFGNVCKILIILKDKTIDRKQHYIGVIEDNVQKRGCATYFLNLSGVAGLPALMTFGLGANADELEFMPEKQLKELIASRLRVFADESFSANDFEIKRTSWRGNPNFKGTYAYSGVETKPKHWENMAKPIFERNMHFCGEHTHSKYRGTVHGAYLSGINSALCILKEIDNDHWQYQAGQSQESQHQQVRAASAKGCCQIV